MTRRISTQQLWPTPVMYVEHFGADVDAHNESLARAVIAGCEKQSGSKYEMRLLDLQDVDCPSVRWLCNGVAEACAIYCGFDGTDGIDVGLRGVLLGHGNHISTHTEMSESDIGVAYWPSGDRARIGTEINRRADGMHAPIFKVEDPSRHISDLRLPFEHPHSVDVCPRPGLMAIYPAHLPHNVHPYMGHEPFIQIVAQVRMPWPKHYGRT